MPNVVAPNVVFIDEEGVDVRVRPERGEIADDVGLERARQQ